MSQIFFWQPVITSHVVHTYLAAAEALERKPLALVAARELAFRREQGWTEAQSVMPVAVVTDHEGRSLANAALNDADAIHLFGSPFEPGPIAQMMREALRRHRRVYLVSEPYMTAKVGYDDDRRPQLASMKSLLRPLAWWVRAARLRGNVKGVFAISELAVSQFRALGFKSVIPFGYFIPAPRETVRQNVADTAALRLIYVGSMIRRKNVGALLEAMRRVDRSVAVLDVYGSTEPEWEGNLPPNVHWCGRIPFGMASEVMRRYDVAVVPSLHDGWSVAVNEAIAAGCAVLVSRETGASVLVRRFDCGRDFAAADIDGLVRQIDQLARDRSLLSRFKANAATHAKHITSRVAGNFMAAQLDGQAMKNPWYE